MAEIWVDLILNRKNLTLTIIVIEFVLFPSPSPHTLTELFLHVTAHKMAFIQIYNFLKFKINCVGRKGFLVLKNKRKANNEDAFFIYW